ncbi:DUF3592 domain-containing protein [Marinobacter sp. F4216]|uniref:DUF3592 domain-containing protein n=1 Tax=Marinobacter sp. F4216 TaxID=2874281 RepID=UPI001CC13320|nr:DUF3592 domain-containing protein [Marinobacter sp. F4216]MBZ2168263.1 DUF3592 domain-containing protein [Marinobacter sp. F4216]
MTTLVQNKKSGLGVNLFGLIFLLVGLGVFIGGPVHTVYEHIGTGDWRQVPANLDSIEVKTHRGSDSTTYSIRASYRYEYNGRTFSASRVGYDRGSDNLSDYHYEVVSRLRHISNRGGLTAWINPEAPSESYLVRELRWEKLAFGSIFGIVFAGGGLFVMFLARRQTASGVPGTNGQLIYSSEKQGFWMFAFMSFLFIGVSLPVTLKLPEEIGKGNWAILLALAFPAIGIWLGFKAREARKNWRFYGPTPLMLNPTPGQVGGDIGGSIALPGRLPPGTWKVTLQCVRVRISGGKNSRRSESVAWQEDQVPEISRESSGSVARFVFTPPTSLPETDNQGNRMVKWRVLLDGPKEPVPMERTFEIPVMKGTQTSSIKITEAHLEKTERQTQTQSIASAAEQIDVAPSGSGWLITSRHGRHTGMTLGVMFVGLLFSAASIGLGYMAAKEGFMLYVMAGAFGLFGFPMLIGGLFMAGRSLKAHISGPQVEVVRYWFGKALWKRQGTLTSTHQLTLKSSGSMSSGRKTTEFFSLAFKDARDGKDIRIAEGIAEGISGRRPAEALQEQLSKLIGLK